MNNYPIKLILIKTPIEMLTNKKKAVVHWPSFCCAGMKMVCLEKKDRFQLSQVLLYMIFIA